jgi:hypothetical protein
MAAAWRGSAGISSALAKRVSAQSIVEAGINGISAVKA